MKKTFLNLTIACTFLLVCSCSSDEESNDVSINDNNNDNDNIPVIKLNSSEIEETIVENSINDTEVYDLKTVVSNLSDETSFEIISQDVEAFEISDNKIIILDENYLNYEVRTSISGKISVSEDSFSETINFKILIEDDKDETGTVSTYATGFIAPQRIEFDNEGNLYVTDLYDYKVLKVNSSGVVSTYAGTGEQGNQEGSKDVATLYNPYGLDFDSGGNLYFADYFYHKIRKIDAEGNVSTYAGGEFNDTYEEDILTPMDITIDDNDNIYVTDFHNGSLSKINADGTVKMLFKEIFESPTGVTIDNDGNIYVLTNDNPVKLYKIIDETTVTVLAGSGDSTSVDGIGELASFESPTDIVYDNNEYIYLTQSSDPWGNRGHIISRVSISTGEVITIAGTGEEGFVNGSLAEAKFRSPGGLAIDKYGNLYVADRGNKVIRKITF